MVTQEDRIRDNLEFCRVTIDALLRSEYGLRLQAPVIVNPYLRTAHGLVRVAHLKGTGKPDLAKTRIEFNKKVLLNASKEHLRGVAKHEGVHYALLMLGKPYRDGTKMFESEIRRLGVPSNFGEVTEESRGLYKDSIKDSLWYFCECESCGKLVKFWKRTPPKGAVQKMARYRSICCRSKLVYKGGEDAQVVMSRVVKQNEEIRAKRGLK